MKKITILISTILLVSCDIKNNPVSENISSSTQIKDSIKDETKYLDIIELPKQKNIDISIPDNYNYSPYINIDSNGNGLIIYTGTYRKIINYKIQTKEYNFDINSSKEKITLNKNGDGFIVYEKVNGNKSSPEGSEESFNFTLRSIKNFDIQSTDIETNNKVYEHPYINIDDNNNGYMLSLNPEASYDFADRIIFNRFFQFNNTVSLRKIENGILQKESKNIGSIPSKFNNLNINSKGSGSLFDFGIYISNKEQFKNLTGQEINHELDSQNEGFLDFSRVDFNNFNIDKPILLKTFFENKNTKLFIRTIDNYQSNLIRVKPSGDIMVSKFENDKETIKDVSIGKIKYYDINFDESEKNDSNKIDFSYIGILDINLNSIGNGYVILKKFLNKNNTFSKKSRLEIIKINKYQLEDKLYNLGNYLDFYKPILSINENGNGIIISRIDENNIKSQLIKSFTPLTMVPIKTNNDTKSNQEKEPMEVIYLKDLEAKKQETPKISLRHEINTVNTSQDNIIDIVFDRKAKIRIENGTKNLSSEITDISELLKILEENNFISGVSLKHTWMTDEEVERDADDFAKIVEGPSTDRYSTQMYTFGKGTDILKVCNQLRKLSYVISANPPLSPTDG